MNPPPPGSARNAQRLLWALVFGMLLLNLLLFVATLKRDHATTPPPAIGVSNAPASPTNVAPR